MVVLSESIVFIVFLLDRLAVVTIHFWCGVNASRIFGETTIGPYAEKPIGGYVSLLRT